MQQNKNGYYHHLKEDGQMQNEYLTVYQTFYAGIGLTFSSFLYSLGGRGKKFYRRFISSFILACTVNGLMYWRGLWSSWFLLVYPLLCIGFSLGYSADNFGIKLLRRTTYALAVLSSGLLIAIVLGGNAWMVFIFHVIIGMSSIYLGTKNFVLAPAEEFLICIVLNLGLISYPFI